MYQFDKIGTRPCRTSDFLDHSSNQFDDLSPRQRLSKVKSPQAHLAFSHLSILDKIKQGFVNPAAKQRERNTIRQTMILTRSNGRRITKNIQLPIALLSLKSMC